MATITRFYIDRYKEIILLEKEGTIPDGGFSTYNLDNPTLVPGGTGDFLGVIRDIRLLGEIKKVTVDIKKYTANQFNALTQDQYNTFIKNGTFGYKQETIGWVQINKARPSFYYKDCDTPDFVGKQPIVEHYYSLSDFVFDNKVVNGSGPNDEGSDVSFSELALNPVNTFDPNIANNLGPIAPRFDPINLNEYINAAFYGGLITNQNGETISIGGALGNDESRPIIVNLYLANKSEHFDNKYAKPSADGKYGFIRNVMNDGFSSFSHVIDRNISIENVISNIYIGSCLSIKTKTKVPDQKTTEDDPVVQDWMISESGGGPDEEGNYEYDTEDDTFVDLSNPIVDESCNELSPRPLRYPNTGVIQDAKAMMSSVKGGEAKNYNESLGADGINDQFPFYVKKQEQLEAAGVVDPREILQGVGGLQRGVLKYIKNSQYCTFDVYPNFRDKDGDVPELVGSNLVSYMEKIRVGMIDKFYMNPPLKLIGEGTDGLEYFSDGNSYQELLGESIFGCGRAFALSDIHEIFTEMYKNENEKKDEEKDTHEQLIEHYRFVVERSTKFTGLVMTLIDAIGSSATKQVLKSKKKLLLNDVVDDIVMGIPDMDFAQIGSLPTLTSVLTRVGTAAIPALVQYYTMPENENTANIILKILRAAFVGWVGGDILLSELFESEENLYNKRPNLLQNDLLNGRTPDDIFKNGVHAGEFKSINGRPINIFEYRPYDSLWSRSILSSVYAENNGIKLEETISQDGKIIRSKSPLLVRDLIPSIVNRDESKWGDSERTVEDLKKLQSALALPSRWKSMMRPIYQELWYDQDAIKPENVSTMPYLGQDITTLELGDYETHRKLFGMKKNLYDEIDETISIKIHTDTLSGENLTSSDLSFFRALVDSSRRMFREFLNRSASSPTSFLSQQQALFSGFVMHLTDAINYYDAKNTRGISEFIHLIDNLINVYGISRELSNAPNQLKSSIQNYDQIAKEEKKTFLEKFKNDSINFIKEFFNNLIKEVTSYIITAGLSYLENSLEQIDSKRISLSPRRVMKPGSVILRSKSMQYITNKQPCPIIFLGFNDDAIMSAFSDIIPGALDCLTSLSKEDVISTLQCSNVYPLQKGQNIDLFSNVLQTNLGNYSLDLNLGTEGGMVDASIGGQTSTKTNTYQTPYAYSMYSKIDTIPTINKRIRQYGRNPFLDIFYLNIIPDSYYADGAKDYQRNTKMHLGATPPPFRYTTLRNIKFSRVTNSNIPSIFPPWWNEPIVKEQNPESSINFFNTDNNESTLFEGSSTETFWKDSQDWNLGDFHYQNRRRNNILLAKDRWSMSIESVGSSESDRVAVLTDKTPILDIYFGLLNMHVLGFGWDQILPIIRETKNAVKIGTYFDKGVLVPDEKNSKIDLNALENVNKKIQRLLSTNKPVIIEGETTWKSIPISTDKPKLDTKIIKLYNQGKDVKIELFPENIKIRPNGRPDKFGQTSDNVFYFGRTSVQSNGVVNMTSPNLEIEPIVKMNKWKIENVTPKFWKKYLDEWDTMELEVHFVPFRVEEGFEYKATLEIPVSIDGKMSIITQELSAICSNSSKNISESQKYTSNIKLPRSIYFGIINDIKKDVTEYSIPIGLNIKEDVIITSFRIDNQEIFDKEENRNITKDFFKDNPAEIFIFPEYSVYNASEINKSNKILIEEFYESLDHTKNQIGEYVNINFGPKVGINTEDILKQNSVWGGSLRKSSRYRAEVLVKYVLAPRINSEEVIYRQSSFLLEFYTI